jgi:hypothetical protein
MKKNQLLAVSRVVTGVTGCAPPRSGTLTAATAESRHHNATELRAHPCVVLHIRLPERTLTVDIAAKSLRLLAT